jgi:O-antigen ligase
MPWSSDSLPAFNGPHCLYLHVLYEQGLVGLAALATLVWSIVASAYRSIIPTKLLLTGLLCQWLAAGVTESLLPTRGGWIPIAFAVFIATIDPILNHSVGVDHRSSKPC